MTVISRPIGRPKGSIKPPSYCRHKATDRAYVTLNGRPVYLGRYGSKESRAEYDRVVGEFLAAGRQSHQDRRCGNGPTGSGMKMETLLYAFWQHAVKEYPAPKVEPEKRPAGELGNFWDVLRPLKRLYVNTEADSFGPIALKTLRAEMVGLGWSRNYVNRQISRVKFIFKWAVANEMLAPSVYQALAAVNGLRRGRSEARETAPVKPVPDHILESTLPWLGRYVRSMMELQRLTGMRPGELCSMRTANIETAGKVWVYRPTQHKTAHHGHDREIHIGPRAQEVLKPFLKPDLAAFIFSPIDAENERHQLMRTARQTPVQPSQAKRAVKAQRRGRLRAPLDHYTVASYRRAINRACDRANAWAKGGLVIDNAERIIPRWHPHQLRHNFASSIRRDYGPDAALVLLGDRTTRMVDVYAEKDRRSATQIIAAVG